MLLELSAPLYVPRASPPAFGAARVPLPVLVRVYAPDSAFPVSTSAPVPVVVSVCVRDTPWSVPACTAVAVLLPPVVRVYAPVYSFPVSVAAGEPPSDPELVPVRAAVVPPFTLVDPDVAVRVPPFVPVLVCEYEPLNQFPVSVVVPVAEADAVAVAELASVPAREFDPEPDDVDRLVAVCPVVCPPP